MIVVLQVERTRHYLLLREKLESTLLLGQEVPLSCVCEDLTESSSPSKHLGQGHDSDADPGHEIINERQRKLAAKVNKLNYFVLSKIILYKFKLFPFSQ